MAPDDRARRTPPARTTQDERATLARAENEGWPPVRSRPHDRSGVSRRRATDEPRPKNESPDEDADAQQGGEQ